MKYGAGDLFWYRRNLLIRDNMARGDVVKTRKWIGHN